MYDPEVWMELARSERRKDLDELARYRAVVEARRERGDGYGELRPRRARWMSGWRMRLRHAAEPGCEQEMGIP